MTELSHDFTSTMPATRARVFEAFTDPAQLRAWFAEHASVEPRVGGDYRFWGKYSYGTATRESATQAITRYEPDTALSYAWTIDGIPSDVALTFEDADDGQTKVSGTHRFDRAPTDVRTREFVDDLWKVHFGNLMEYLMNGSVAARPDFTDPRPRIEISTEIEAPRAAVFRALLDPDTLNRWVASAAVVDARVGGEYRYGWKYKVDGRDVLGGPTRIIELIENERLVTDWPDWRGQDDGPLTTATWLVDAISQTRTRVTLVHGVFPRTVDLGDYPAGWGYFLSRLKGELEKVTSPAG